jgi:hypothetical protein
METFIYLVFVDLDNSLISMIFPDVDICNIRFCLISFHMKDNREIMVEIKRCPGALKR